MAIAIVLQNSPPMCDITNLYSRLNYLSREIFFTEYNRFNFHENDIHKNFHIFLMSHEITLMFDEKKYFFNSISSCELIKIE